MRLSTRLTVAMVGLVALTATAVGVIIHYNIEARALPRALDRLDTHAHMLGLHLEAAVRSAQVDVTVQGQAVAGLTRALAADGIDPRDGTPAAVWRGRLASRFIAELGVKPDYAQFRLIGVADGGREIVRVDRMGPDGAVRVVPESELQRKGDRGYFAAAVKLSAGQIYAAPIDFNREHGALQIPHVPTLRVAAPVVTPAGEIFGIMIVNVDMRSAFDRIRAEGRRGAVYVVNENGDYLVHPDRIREFGFELGTPFRIQDEFPDFQGLLGRDDTTPRIVKNRDGEQFGIGWDSVVLAGGPRVTVFEAVPRDRVLATGAAVPSLLGGLIAVLGGLPLAVFLARSLSRPLVQMTDAIEGFSRGETLPVPVKAGGEIGILARSFTRMTEEMREKAHALQRETEEHRRTGERERLFSAAVESSEDAIVTTTLDGTITGWNPGAERMFGFTAEEAVGADASIIVPEDRCHERQSISERIVSGERISHYETVRRHKEGWPIQVSISISPVRSPDGTVIGAAAIIRDITESMNAQEAIRDSERMARGIIDHSLDAIIQVNEAGDVVEWNPQAEAMFGWTRQEALGKPISELYLPPGYRPRYLDMNEHLRQNEDAIVSARFDFDALRKDDKTIKVEVSMTGFRRRGGNVFNLFLRDITQKLAAEEQLRQAQKMEAVGQLTGGIAHDFNNMLTVITGTVEILADGVADRPELAAIAKLIGEAADRGAELTSHLLAFARKQPLRPRDADVNALMVESSKLLKPAIGEHIDIELMLDDTVWPAIVDTNQLTTALLNLAVNARDAMPYGGKLTLETRNVLLDQAYCDANQDVGPGNYVMIAVSDTGGGIPKTIVDKVFEPFFSTKEPGKGTGLGLSMVYGFIKQSGGHIKIYSEEGHGTTIRMYLPQASAQSAGDTQEEEITMTGGRETILVVEDDAMVRSSVMTQLQSLGYGTIAVSNAAEALAIVDGGATFDLLFTDVILTGSINGRQLAEEIERRRPGTKVLFTSGYTENAIVHHGRLDPGVLLLAKPYRKSDFARMLRVALGGEAEPESIAPAQPKHARSA